MNKTIHKYNIITALIYFARLSTTLMIPLHFGRFGFSAELVATYAAILGMSKTTTSFISGIASDIIGKKVILTGSVFLGALVQLGLALSSSSWSIIIFLIIDGIAFGAFMSIRGPLITTLAEYRERGSVFGLFAAVSNIVGIFGGVLVGYAMDIFSGKVVFCFLSVIFLFAGILSISIKIPVQSKPIKAIKLKNIKTPLTTIPFTFILVLAINFIQILVTAPLWQVVMPLYLTRIYGKTALFTGIIYSLDSGFSVISSYLFGKGADKLETYKVSIITALSMALIAIAIPFSIEGPIVFIVLYLGFNIIFSGFSPVLEKIESGTVRENYSGFDYTLIRLVLGIGTALGNVISGIIISREGGYGFFFYLVAIGYLVVSILLSLMKRLKKEQSVTPLA